jgi:hypothetical protein
MSTIAERAVARTPRRLALRLGNLSDKAIAWLFITPSVLLLLADQHLPVAVDDPALVHQLPGQSPERGRCDMSGSTITATY